MGDDQEERRRHQRAPVGLQASLNFPSVQQFLSAYAGDVSESGMFIRTEGPAHGPGQLVTLRFEAWSWMRTALPKRAVFGCI